MTSARHVNAGSLPVPSSPGSSTQMSVHREHVDARHKVGHDEKTEGSTEAPLFFGLTAES